MITRRNFLKGIAGTIAALSLSSLLGCSEKYPAPPERKDYHMAMVVLSPKDSPPPCGQLEMTVETATVLSEQFSEEFSAATQGRVTVDVDEISVLDWIALDLDPVPIELRANRVTNDVLNAVAKYNSGTNENDRFDFITVIAGYDTNALASHTSIFNTSNRIDDNQSNPKLSKRINSQRIIGINYLGTIYGASTACSQHGEISDLFVSYILSTLFEEFGHQYGAFIKGNDLIIIDGIREHHFNGRLTNLIDSTNDGWYIPLQKNAGDSEIYWEDLGNNRLKLHRPEYPSSDFKRALIRSRPIGQLNQWVMGAKEYDELTDSYVLIEGDLVAQGFITVDGYTTLPPEGTVVTARTVTAKELIMDHILNQ